jgi:prepilin-type N-terminal cleavage/methylation domain-containing protein
MSRTPKNKKMSSGFTIVELLIATAVFAVVLLVAQASFVQIGHLFYRGVSINQTQDAADHIFQDINGNFQTAPSVDGSVKSATGGYNYYCIGNTRYTYTINQEVDTSAPASHAPYNSTTKTGGNYGILKDILPGAGAACETPCDDLSGSPCPANSAKLSNPSEILGNRMRLERFDICQSTTTSNLYNVNIVLAYGDDSTLKYTSTLAPSDMKCQTGQTYYSSVQCQGDTHNDFCAVSSIITAVYKGGH